MSAQIIDFAAARQKRLAAALTERYGLVPDAGLSAARVQQLSKDISTLEYDLARPQQRRSVRVRLDRAA
jgi:hypothetical protein